MGVHLELLFFNTSKIQFESKSQLLLLSVAIVNGCFSIRQRYNLKANHNHFHDLLISTIVVFQYVKDTIWKQITTCIGKAPYICMLFFNTSKIQFESKSQQIECVGIRVSCCFSIRQRYNLKANHNHISLFCFILVVVFQYVKDTIWKQITTRKQY